MNEDMFNTSLIPSGTQSLSSNGAPDDVHLVNGYRFREEHLNSYKKQHQLVQDILKDEAFAGKEKEVDLSIDEVVIPTPEDEINSAIEKEVEESKEKERQSGNQQDELDYNPQLIKDYIDFSKIPLYDNIIEERKRPLHSTSDEGKRVNAEFVPHREQNYITPHMQKPKREGNEPIANNELIFTVAFYHPERNIKVQTFNVLGSQTLTMLRDCVYCLSDHILDGPSTKSGYFFIENVFYDDLRDPTSIPYSKEIIDWVNEDNRWRKSGLAKYTSRRMEDTTFMDLSLRVGEKYLYCHQGDCKHYMVFTEVRMIHPDDIQNKNYYPLKTFQCKVRKKKCGVCDIYPPKFVTYNDKLCPESPFFFCEHCYFPLHYTKDGELRYSDFEVYNYYHE